MESYVPQPGLSYFVQSNAFLDASPSLPSESTSGSSFPNQQKRRECTDKGCLVLFLAFAYGLWVVYAGARAEGNLAKLTHGFDWKGDICGVDTPVADRPLLFWCVPGTGEDITLLHGICVEHCPLSAGTQNWCPGSATPFEHRQPPENGRQEVVIGMARTLTLQQDYPTIDALGYCFPTKNLELLNRIMDNTHLSSLTKQAYLASHGALESWHFLVGVAGVCIVIGYLFLLILWFCFAKLVYGLVIVTHLALLLVTYCFVYAGFHDKHNVFISYFERHTAHIAAWVCGAVTFLLWLLFTCFCCYSKRAVAVTIDSVKIACETIAQIPTILLQPLVHSIVMICTLLSLVYGLAWLLSTGKVVPADVPLKQGGIQIEGLQRNVEFSGWQWGCVFYWAFGLVWIFETLNALGQFAISHAVVVFACYRTPEWFPMLHGYVTGLIFHLGTLAFGGFVIGCLKILAVVTSYLAKQGGDQPGVQGTVTRVCCCCCAQCFVIVERLLSLVNDLVYTDVALRGVGYVEAAENVVRIASRNPAAYVGITGSATAIRVLGVATIGTFGTVFSYQVLSSTELHQELDSVFQDASSILVTSNIIGTTIAAGVICFYVAMAFMMVFYQTTYTLMYCMLIGVLTLDQDGVDGVIKLQRREMNSGLLDKL